MANKIEVQRTQANQCVRTAIQTATILINIINHTYQKTSFAIC